MLGKPLLSATKVGWFPCAVVGCVPGIRISVLCLAVILFTGSCCQTLLSDEPDSGDDPPPQVESSIQPIQIPDWYYEKPTRTENGVFLVAKTGPFDNPNDADDALNDSIRDTVCRYLRQYSGTRLSALDLPDDLIEQWIVDGRRKCRRFSEELAERYGVDQSQYFAFAHLFVNDETIKPFFDQAQERQIRSRLKISGLIGIGMLGLIGIAWGYLKIDQATRGFHSRSLRRMALLVSLVFVVGLLVLFGLV